MVNQMMKRRKFLIREIEKCKKDIDELPLGKFEIHKNGKTERWRIVAEGKRIELPKADIHSARRYARKMISVERLAVLQKELYAIDQYIRHAPDIQAMAEKTVKYQRILDKDKQDPLPWHLQEYETNDAFTDNLMHPSPSGHVLRSKSECLIDMSLYYRKVPFRYESKLILGRHVIYPDFTFYNERSGEYKYWEHFGMMGDYKYRKKALEKEELYIVSGLMPNENVIFTYETEERPLSASAVDHIIDMIIDWLE